MANIYQFGQNLTTDGFFQMLCEEAYRDGILDIGENRLLAAFGKGLRLDASHIEAIKGRARRLFGSGELGPRRQFDPRRLYKRVLRYILCAGSLGALDRLAIRSLCKVFGFSRQDHVHMLHEARQEIDCTESVFVSASWMSRAGGLEGA